MIIYFSTNGKRFLNCILKGGFNSFTQKLTDFRAPCKQNITKHSSKVFMNSVCKWPISKVSFFDKWISLGTGNRFRLNRVPSCQVYFHVYPFVFRK